MYRLGLYSLAVPTRKSATRNRAAGGKVRQRQRKDWESHSTDSHGGQRNKKKSSSSALFFTLEEIEAGKPRKNTQ